MTALVVVVLLPGICTGQDSASDAAAPHMVRAAGMPLNDGSLAPGMLTVRIVEGAFTRNLSGLAVEVEVAGGKIESAPTGPDGRAQFAHLPVGARVRALATVDGERLESEFFVMPAQSGVRILLVAGEGAAPSTGQAVAASAPPTTAAAELSVAAAAPLPTSPAETGVAVIRAVLATATVSVFGFLFLTRRQRR